MLMVLCMDQISVVLWNEDLVDELLVFVDNALDFVGQIHHDHQHGANGQGE